MEGRIGKSEVQLSYQLEYVVRSSAYVLKPCSLDCTLTTSCPLHASTLKHFLSLVSSPDRASYPPNTATCPPPQSKNHHHLHCFFSHPTILVDIVLFGIITRMRRHPILLFALPRWRSS